MSPEEHTLLEKSLALSKENNEILRKMQRSLRVGRIFNIVYWVILIGLALGAYVFIEPYVQRVQNEYGSLGGSFTTIINDLKK